MSPLVVLVTGCSTGSIGYTLCEEYAARGCKVYATSRNLSKVQDFKNPSITKLTLDVTSDEDVNRAVSHIMEVEGRIDILVNNAGALCAGPLIDQDLDYTKYIFDVNALSILRISKVVIPLMAKRRSGKIVNIGSVVGEISTPWNGIYCASKAAVKSISEVLSMECRPFNIDVIHIAPGSVKSNIATNEGARYRLPENSLYSSYLPNIIQRINASQTAASMPTREFAQIVVTKTLRDNPPQYLLIGGSSLVFKVLRWLPSSWVLWLMWRIYTKKITTQ